MTATPQSKPHSAEYFGETRDYWWNRDFLELMAKRLNFAEIQTVLDVGCGIGHWGQALAPFLPPQVRLTGIDREDAWIAKATARARAMGLESRCEYQHGDVLNLAFDAGTFDMVTCQTLLIHLKDPRAGLREMLRVLKPGGLLLATEPNNLANRAVGSSLIEKLSVDEVIDRLRLGLFIERGKQRLGLGFNSVGDLIPGYLAELGAENIRVYLSDKAVPCLPPYSSQEQQANVQQTKEWAKRGFIGWDRDELLAYYLAGGGCRDEFDRYVKLLGQDGEDTVKAMETGTYHTGGGCLTYLIAAVKPQESSAMG